MVDAYSKAEAPGGKKYNTSSIRASSYDPGTEVMSFGRVRDLEGVYLREAPQVNGIALKKLAFNSRVFVSHELTGDWYVVALDDGCFGYVFSKHVSIHPPEPNALLHKIVPNQGALEIVKKYYKKRHSLGAG